MQLLLQRFEKSYPDLIQKLDTECPQIMGKIRKSDPKLQFIKIYFGAIAAAVIYGIIHDQITTHLCLEYFTEGFHKHNVKGTFIEKTLQKYPKSATWHGLIWGTIATWWVGAIIGIPLVAATQMGPWPKLTLKELIKPTLIMLSATGLSAVIGGVTSYHTHPELTNNFMNDEFQVDVKLSDKTKRCYWTAAEMHRESYGAGAVFSISLIGWSLWMRYKKTQKFNTEREKFLRTIMKFDQEPQASQ